MADEHSTSDDAAAAAPGTPSSARSAKRKGRKKDSLASAAMGLGIVALVLLVGVMLSAFLFMAA